MKEQEFKVDLILTDPPYNISKKNNFKSIGRSGIDFGEWDKGFDQLAWLDGISKVMNDNGSIIIFNDWKNMGLISQKLEQEDFEIKDLIRWIKPAPMPRNTNRRYVTDFEFAIWAVKKNSKWVFNKVKDKPYLKPEYVCQPPCGNKRIHPTQKPEQLIDDIINVHSNKGDIIFDPFSGSGTISYCANKLDRYFIACEKEKKYWEESNNRIKKSYIRPAFNHLGNKSRIIQELIANFPKTNIKNFVEPFAGSGIVSMSYSAASKYWLNDMDNNLSSILEYLFNTKPTIVINEIESIIKQFKLPTKPNIKYTEEYNNLKNSYNRDKKINKLLVLVLFGFNQQIRFNAKGKFNIPVGKFYWNDYHKEKVMNFITKSNRKDVEIRSLDFQDFITEIEEKYLNPKETLFYFDPPYLLSNATYNDVWNEEDEKRLIILLECLTKKGYKWCLSNVLSSKGKRNKILEDFINKGFVNYKVLNEVNYHNSNYQRRNRENLDEEILVWGNYE